MGANCSLNSQWRWRRHAREEEEEEEEEESRWRLRYRNACEMRLFGAVGMREARNRRLLRVGSLWRFFPAHSTMWSFDELQQRSGLRSASKCCSKLWSCWIHRLLPVWICASSQGWSFRR